MKFEQALKAMRRGERVRRKRWKLTCPRAVIWIGADGAIKDNFNGGEKPGFTRDSHIVADDWVIVRKKKKPRFSEDELEPVGTVPVAGDRMLNGREQEYVCSGIYTDCYGRRFASIEDAQAWMCFELFASGEYRILKRPAKPLRDVFADPRVNDVVKSCSGLRHTVVYRGGKQLATETEFGTIHPKTLAGFTARQNQGWTIVSRAE